MNYKLKVANREELRIDRAGIVTAGFVVQLDKTNGDATVRSISAPFYLPSEGKSTISLNLAGSYAMAKKSQTYSMAFDKKELITF